MTDNRYAYFQDPGEVLDDYANTLRTHGFNSISNARADALARIRELTPPAKPVLLEEARERLQEVVADLYSSFRSDYVIDRIIDALGYTEAPTDGEFSDPANWHPIEEHPYLNDPPGRVTEPKSLDNPAPESPPGVDLDVKTLRTVSNLADWFSCRQYPDHLDATVDGQQVTIYRDEHVGTRLRIGGEQ